LFAGQEIAPVAVGIPEEVVVVDATTVEEAEELKIDWPWLLDELEAELELIETVLEDIEELWLELIIVLDEYWLLVVDCATVEPIDVELDTAEDPEFEIIEDPELESEPDMEPESELDKVLESEFDAEIDVALERVLVSELESELEADWLWDWVVLVLVIDELETTLFEVWLVDEALLSKLLEVCVATDAAEADAAETDEADFRLCEV
jgi:hypothetical protein